MNEIPTVDEMAMAHLRLSQSLRSMRMSCPAWEATEQALDALAKGIAARANPGAGRWHE